MLADLLPWFLRIAPLLALGAMWWVSSSTFKTDKVSEDMRDAVFVVAFIYAGLIWASLLLGWGF